MTPLTFVEPSTASTWNVLLYGPGGNGKTVGACSAPGPVVILNADGPGGTRKAHSIYGDQIRELPYIDSTTLNELYLYVTSPEGADVRTVVLDPVGEIYQKMFEEFHADGASRKDALAAHGDVQTKIERFVRSMRDLPVNLVLVCHEEVADQEGQPLRRPMTGGKKLPEKIVGMMDIVGYVGVVPADAEKGTPRRWVAQLVEGLGRRAKDRSEGLGDSRDIDLSEWFPVATQAMAENPADAADNNKETKEK